MLRQSLIGLWTSYSIYLEDCAREGAKGHSKSSLSITGQTLLQTLAIARESGVDET